MRLEGALVALSGERMDRRISAESAGVGLVRSEYVVRSTGAYFGVERCDRALRSYLSDTADRAAGKPVIYRLADLESRDVNLLEGHDDVLDEDNPLLGLRGALRSLRYPEALEAEMNAIRDVVEMHSAISLLVPMLNDFAVAREVLDAIRERGIRSRVGAMIETPGAVREADKILSIYDFATVGMNDLTGLTLGIGRTSSRFDYCHPAVLESVREVIQAGDHTSKNVFIAGNFDEALPIALPELHASRFVVHYVDWDRLTTSQLHDYEDKHHAAELRRASDRRLVAAGSMPRGAEVATSGMRPVLQD